jgi:hypothetical protein
VEKYGTARQATDDNIIRSMRFACWITKATNTHSKYLIRIAFPRQEWFSKGASCIPLPCIFCDIRNTCRIRFLYIWEHVTICSTRRIRDGRCGVRIPVEEKIFSSPYVQTGSADHPSLLFNGYQDYFPRVKGRGVMLITCLYLPPRIRMSGFIPLLSAYACMACVRFYAP